MSVKIKMFAMVSLVWWAFVAANAMFHVKHNVHPATYSYVVSTMDY